jgi:hypothetical protein
MAGDPPVAYHHVGLLVVLFMLFLMRGGQSFSLTLVPNKQAKGVKGMLSINMCSSAQLMHPGSRPTEPWSAQATRHAEAPPCFWHGMFCCC